MKIVSSDRKIPRTGCSIPCVLKVDGKNIEGDIADVSSNGMSFIPRDPDFLKGSYEDKVVSIDIDMADFSDIGNVITFDAVFRWHGGLFFGLEIESIDTPNFKKWWYLVYKLFFNSKAKV